MRAVLAHPTVRVLLFGAGYAVLAAAGVAVRARYGDIPAIWLPAGLAVGTLVLAPRARWPAYIGALALADAAIYTAMGMEVVLGAGLILADTVEPVIGATLLRVLSRDRTARGPGTTLRFLLACGAAAPLAGGLIAGAAYGVGGDPGVIDAWRTAWAADALGVLAVAPAVLVIGGRASRRPTLRGSLALAGAVTATLAIALLVMRPGVVEPYPYLVMAPAIAIALRFGAVGAAVTNPLLALTTLLLTAEGGGAFGALGGVTALHHAQVFSLVTAAVLLVAGAVADAQRSAHEQASARLQEADDARRRFERIASSIDEGVFTYRRIGRTWLLEYASPAWTRIFGLPATRDAGDILEQRVHPDDIEAARDGWTRVEGGEWVEQEYRYLHPDGSVRWVNERLRLRVEDGAAGTGWVDGIVSDVTARRREEARREQIASRLRVMSRTDPLTGLANRRHLTVELERHLARCRAGGPGLGLLLLDLDRFKVVNDTFGHHAGDEVLRQAAQRIAEATASAGALAGRWGGEEFCVLVPRIRDLAQLRAVGEAIRAAVGSRPMQLADGSELAVTTTIGGAMQEAASAARAPELVDRADRALYAGKRRGRDRVVLDADLRAGDATSHDSDLLHTAQALALAVSIREGVPALHCQQVADLAGRTAEQLGLPAAAVLRARLGGWLHDVGKIAIPDAILGKRGPLDEAEWEIMRAHPSVGAEVVRRVPGLDLAADAVEQHHERWDGTGYPAGRRGEEIALEARIVACADAYSAITSDRVYRPERSRGEGIAELHRAAGSHLDPTVVAALVAVLEHDEREFAARLRPAGD